MVIVRGFLLAALCAITITGWVIGLSDLYVGLYGDGITLVIPAAVISLLLAKITARFFDEMPETDLGHPNKPANNKMDEDDLLPPAVYDTIGYGLLVIAGLVGIGGPLTTSDYMGNYLNPAIGIFLLLMGLGVFRFKKNRANHSQTDKTENQTRIQPVA